MLTSFAYYPATLVHILTIQFLEYINISLEINTTTTNPAAATTNPAAATAVAVAAIIKLTQFPSFTFANKVALSYVTNDLPAIWIG